MVDLVGILAQPAGLLFLSGLGRFFGRRCDQMRLSSGNGTTVDGSS